MLKVNALPLSLTTLLLVGCATGTVVRDAPRHSGLDGVTVRAKPCPNCAVVEAQTDDFGRFTFGFWRDVAPAQGGEATEYTFIRDGYRVMTVYHNPLLGRPLQVVMTARGEFRDRDLDGLSDTHEIFAGSNPNATDSDADGIPDAWEVLGHEWVDYASWGAHPAKRDIFVEVDYEQTRQGDAIQSSRLSRAVIQKMVELFASLDAGDGEGFVLHIIQDDPIDRRACGSLPDDFNPLHRRNFHYARTCVGGEFGGGSRPGNFSVTSPATNEDPSDDQTERAQYVWYASFVHELGHSLGLGHGGVDNFGCKPNYPSVMNEPYARGFDPARQTLRDTDVQFSTGSLFLLNEAALLELNPFGNLGDNNVGFLRFYSDTYGGPFPISTTPEGLWVDWNRDGILQRETYSFALRGDHRRCVDPTRRVLVDTNDARFIADHLATIIPPDR